MGFSISKTRQNIRSIAFGEYSLTISSSGVIVSREGKPYHLTICYNEQKAALDLHFTHNRTKEIQDRLIISLDHLASLSRDAQSLISQELSRPGFLKEINLGKLVRHGYWVLLQDPDIYSKRLLRGHRVKKRTIVLNAQNLYKRLFTSAAKSLYPPDILKHYPYSKDGCYILVGIRKRNRHKQRVLYSITTASKTIYYLVRPRSLSNTVKQLLGSSISESVDEFKRNFETYFDADLEKEIEKILHRSA